MNVQVQTINIGSERAVIVPAKTWAKIMSVLEDMADVIAYKRAKQADDGTYITSEELKKQIFGKSRQKTRASAASC